MWGIKFKKGDFYLCFDDPCQFNVGDTIMWGSGKGILEVKKKYSINYDRTRWRKFLIWLGFKRLAGLIKVKPLK